MEKEGGLLNIGKENRKTSSQQEQIHNLLFNREIGWQEIVYDLINTEQLDPWNIDIIVLSNRYLEKIQELEEDNFFISSKVLLAAALFLRIKSEILLNKYIKSIDEILFGKKEQQKPDFERIELDEEIPELLLKSPIPRFRRVTLKELMESLNKAITTENRRIKREILKKNVLREASFSLPKKTFNIHSKIKEIYKKLLDYFNKEKNSRIPFTEFIKLHITDEKKLKEEKIISFYSLLHLDNQEKIWLEQEEHFGEIYILKKELNKTSKKITNDKS